MSDPLFLTVSLIGYLNTIVPLVYLILMLKDRKLFLAQQPSGDTSVAELRK